MPAMDDPWLTEGEMSREELIRLMGRGLSESGRPFEADDDDRGLVTSVS